MLLSLTYALLRLVLDLSLVRAPAGMARDAELLARRHAVGIVTLTGWRGWTVVP